MTRQIGLPYRLLPLEDRVRHLEAEVAALRWTLTMLLDELAATEPDGLDKAAMRVRRGLRQ